MTNLVLGRYLIGAGRKYNSLTLVADGKHVLTDAFTSLGVVIGLLLVITTGYRIIDPLLAIAVAVLNLGYLIPVFKKTMPLASGLGWLGG